MNWNDKRRAITKVVVIFCALYGAGIFLFGFLELDTSTLIEIVKSCTQSPSEYTPSANTDLTSMHYEESYMKSYPKPSFEEISPDGFQTISVYRQDFDPLFFDDNPPDEVVMLVRSTFYTRRHIVFTGEERTGDPHWLGDHHIFFTAYCGTSCQGLYLVDVRSKKTLIGVLSAMFDKQMNWYMHFKDWFGKAHTFSGFVKEMRAEMNDETPILVFETEDDQHHDLGTKRFRFTGNSLVAVQ